MIDNMKYQSYPRKVGEDRILRRGDQLVVCSQVDMEEWQIRDNRKTAVYIDDAVWCLVEKQFSDDGEIRYILDPWPDYLRHIPGRRIRYDEAYVGACREADKKRKTLNRYGPLLGLLKFIIGFLPSGVKAAIEEKIGVPARNASFISIIIELYLLILIVFMHLIFTLASSYARFYSSSVVLSVPSLLLYVIVLTPDLVMRYNSYFRGDASPLGLFEWYFNFLCWILRIPLRKTGMQ